MNTLIQIRPYMQNDYLAIENYHLSHEQAIYTTLPREVVQLCNEDPHHIPFVIYHDKNLVGFFVLHTHYSGNLYTDNQNAVIFKSFSIDSRHQKKGYAYKALIALPQLVKSYMTNKNEILLTVHHTNTPAIKVYEKAGFENKKLTFNGEYGIEIIFHLTL